MSPPPIEATRCRPSAARPRSPRRAATGAGVTTNATVSATNAASAPRLSAFLPGSISGLDLIRADSFRNATIEPVKVTAPMKTPMNTSAWWMRSSERGDLGLRRRPWPRRRSSRSSRPARRPGRRSCAASRSARACRSSRRRGPATGRSTAPIDHRDDEQRRCRSAAMLREARPMVAASAIAMPAMPKTMPCARRLVPGQPGQAQDEQQGGDDVGRLRGGLRQSSALSPSRTCRACGGSRRSRRRC